jgi:tetratricopeptide (TPR) repeat protein
MQVSALNKLGSLFALFMGQFKEAEQVLVRSEELIRKHAQNSSFPELALVRCQMCTAQADFENVVRYMSEVVQIGEEAGIKEHVVVGLEHVATSLAYMTRYDEALDKGLHALQIAREAGNREHEAALLTSAIPFAHIRNGDFATARQVLMAGVEIAALIGASFPLIDGSWLLAEISRLEGNYELALEHAKLAVEAALPLEAFTPFQVVVPLSILGSIYLEISPKFSDKVSEIHRHALRLLESPVGAIAGGIAWADLGFCAMTLGDFEIAEDSIQKGLNYPTIFSLMERPRLLAGAALLALRKGEIWEARHLIDEARVYTDERTMKHVRPLISLIAGKVYRALAEVEKSLQLFEAAEAEALTMNMRPIVWQARAAAAGLLEASGQHEAAGARSDAALAMVKEIASLFRDPDLRAAYLDNVMEKFPA